METPKMLDCVFNEGDYELDVWNILIEIKTIWALKMQQR